MRDGAVHVQLYSELLLASTSPARCALMDALGLRYRAVAPQVDEAVPEAATPAHAASILAERKARAVFARHRQALVIGADQLVSVGGHTFGKPEDAAAAERQLKMLRGRTHTVHTGLCVLGEAFCCNEVDSVQISVHALSDAEVSRYIATGEWQGCAGGFRIEGLGQALFADIGGDRTSIQGLPMQRLVNALRRARIPFFT